MRAAFADRIEIKTYGNGILKKVPWVAVVKIIHRHRPVVRHHNLFREKNQNEWKKLKILNSHCIIFLSHRRRRSLRAVVNGKLIVYFVNSLPLFPSPERRFFGCYSALSYDNQKMLTYDEICEGKKMQIFLNDDDDDGAGKYDTKAFINFGWWKLKGGDDEWLINSTWASGFRIQMRGTFELWFMADKF